MTADGSGMDPFLLFYMLHETDNLFHKFLCIVTMTPIWILVYLVAVLIIYSKNQKRNLLLLIGFVSSVMLNKILKRMFNHPRPHSDLYYGRGMPSDHAQFAVLWAGYFHQLLSHHSRFNWSQFHRRTHQLYIIAIWIWCSLVIVSRYILLFHSVDQLIAGGVIGGGLSVALYKVDEMLVWDSGSGGPYSPFSLLIE